MESETVWPLSAAMVERVARFEAEGGIPPEPRVAATVALLRSAGGELEVYAIRRAATMVFGGMYAFPGGGVDPLDTDPSHLDPLPSPPGEHALAASQNPPSALATESGLARPATGVRSPSDVPGPANPRSPSQAAPGGWAGPSPNWWAQRLGLPLGAARAVVCAAVRELFEEAGVLLAGLYPDSVVADAGAPYWEASRRALAARQRSLTQFFAETRLYLRSDLLLPWSRWITPEFERRRFDTYFFVAVMPEGQRTRDVSGEADQTLWIRPADAMARYRAGEFPMLPPTAAMLSGLAGHTDLAAVVAAAGRRDPGKPVMPRLVRDRGGVPRLSLVW